MKKFKYSTNNFDIVFYSNSNRYIKTSQVIYGVASIKNFTPSIDGFTRGDIFFLVKSRLFRPELLVNNNILSLLLNILPEDSSILLRLASECFLGWFGDTHCDCESQKNNVLDFFNDIDYGLYIHLPQEGKGWGLINKIPELHLQINGMDQEGNFLGQLSQPEAANLVYGGGDRRSFYYLKLLLEELGLTNRKFKLISNNKNKVALFKKTLGLKTLELYTNIPKQFNLENLGEYIYKLYEKNQILDKNEIEQVKFLISNFYDFLPLRAKRLIIKLLKKEDGYKIKSSFTRNIQYSLFVPFKHDNLKKLISLLPSYTNFNYGIEESISFINNDLGEKFSFKVRFNFWEYPRYYNERKMFIFFNDREFAYRYFWEIPMKDMKVFWQMFSNNQWYLKELWRYYIWVIVLPNLSTPLTIKFISGYMKISIYPEKELKDKAFAFWKKIKQKFACLDNIEETECWLGDTEIEKIKEYIRPELDLIKSYRQNHVY